MVLWEIVWLGSGGAPCGDPLSCGDIEGSGGGGDIVSWMTGGERMSSQIKWVLVELLQNSACKSVFKMIFFEALLILACV